MLYHRNAGERGQDARATLSGLKIPREFRGVWVASVENIDWPSSRTLPVAAQKRELLAIIEKCSALHLNAIILQVRPHADALYPSKIEPWSEYLTGNQGTAPKPLWDPLAFAIRECHLRGIELHAWLNPYRAWHPAAKGQPSADHVSVRRPDLVKTYGKFKWMDPAEPEVQKQSLDVVKDILARYDVDGIHIDDYFYPYPVRDAQGNPYPFPDDPAWGRYKAGGGKLGRGDWRRKHVDDFVQSLYRTIKDAKPWVKFGISPFGIYRPGVPKGIKAGIDQYDELYADARKWLHEGWCDYFTPQLYWKIEQAPQSYEKLLDWWLDQNVKGRAVWPGNYSSQVAAGWPAKEIADQIAMTREKKAGGNIHFSMKPLLRGTAGLGKTLISGPYKPIALPPAMPWLGKKAPPKPILTGVKRQGESLAIGWKRDEHVSTYAVFVLRNGAWQLAKTCGGTRIEFDAPGAEKIALVAFSRTGIESEPTTASVK
ncbi:MAG: family 10 glycosylhydrolase [Fimbriimonadaceae bacterium]|nr:family 10 glycosylhydrolase [Fimbriimonadaceae bacterium]